ncbi:hypothetical protein [Mesorhizobium sp. M7A.F.Ca.CA.004.02.1.1]|uniref:hypothetical protein n=1 Tax=Mesorhizobium sp. M7A.F.Ca.CA.004.02.1.1 TaxID=2496690 RepID=UPI000FCCA399|nr:hypothetical protein [Mesorhizobium sp. M7A.F.Ca.CA.004.02.1.1]RVB05670.1 hypothetical protein EN912_02085 [Mesorhizobium sp. M7A.F.Ca.CA.004.02.1.1]
MMTAVHAVQIIQHLSQIAEALTLMSGGIAKAPPVAAAEVPVSPWDSPDVPNDYDTVLGYFSKMLPSAFDMMSEPIADTQRDGFWLKHQAARRGLKVVKVAAPEALQDSGITELNAYPVTLLAERIAA